ncbi:Rne/Rng family ribonuclease [Sphaerisporangium sp. NPDC051011]|uniref:Rne/Rng family ribonuclease n=1 Tax=Sphaerisporangium sp. NPDC051011 TaxID=3155792 RepID=UPI00340E57CD
MLDNEPVVGAFGPDGDITAQQETKPVRRRAASRPAGPPPEEPELPAAPVSAAQAAVVAEPAPAAPASSQVEAGVAEASEPAVAEAPVKRTRTRRVVAKDADGAEAPAKPARASRAKAAKEAAQDAEEAAEGAEVPGVAETAEADAPAAPVRRTRTRATRKTAEAAAPAQPEAGTEAAAPAEPVAPAVSEPLPGVAEAVQAVQAAEAVVAPPRRRRVRKATDAPVPPEFPEVQAVRSSVEKAAKAEVAAALAESMPVDEPLDDEPVGEDVDTLQDTADETADNADDAAEKDVEEPGAQRSLFADPFGLSAMAEARLAAPTVAFQAPAAVFQPIFQAPEPRAAVPPVVLPPQQRPELADEQPEEAEDSAETAADDDDSDDSDDEAGGRRRRRRRGGRGRGRVRGEHDETEDVDDLDDEARAVADEQAEQDADVEASRGSRDGSRDRDADLDDEEAGSSSRRRRRRRRRGGDDAEATSDDPPNTVVRIRAPRAGRSTSVDEVQGFRGSTRLEAKKQRRREGREQGRRRPPVITESEFLARRESVERVMVVRRQGGRTQIAVLEDGVLVEHYVDRESSQSYVGNVYLGKVQNVLPSMEAAFIDVGKGRNAVLYAGEVNFDTAGLEGQPKRIEAALKSGQSVLVQVTKDPMGHKGARLTSQISLPGRYLVYVPDGSMTGISRKLPDKERTRLKTILKKVMPENAGVIVRTAAEGASEDELNRDVARLSAQWENIQRKAKSASPPELLYSEPDLTIRVVRDVFNEDFSSLVVAGDEAWGTVDEYVRYVAPHLADRLTKWEDGDVFAAYRVDEQIAKAMERKVWLPSGGSLVIDRTEAMTVVDVNTGKFTGQGGNLEETVTKNNLEAAEEIVRQLRLRDIGGIIVIDFIDMVLESNRDLVLRRMLECLARDRTKHQVAEVTSLGLVQMTRKRVGQGLLEAFSTQCDCCNGRGLIVSTEPVEAKPEPRGTQGKMAIEKAVAEKLDKAKTEADKILKDGGAAVVANGVVVRDSVTDVLGGSDEGGSQPSARGRRRSRKVTRPAGPAE